MLNYNNVENDKPEKIWWLHTIKLISKQKFKIIFN